MQYFLNENTLYLVFRLMFTFDECSLFFFLTKCSTFLNGNTLYLVFHLMFTFDECQHSFSSCGTRAYTSPVGVIRACTKCVLYFCQAFSLGSAQNNKRRKRDSKAERNHTWECLQPESFHRLGAIQQHAMREMRTCCDEEIRARRANLEHARANERLARIRRRRDWTGVPAASDQKLQLQQQDVLATEPTGADFLSSLRSSAVAVIKPASMLVGLLSILTCCGVLAFKAAPDVFLQRLVQSFVRSQWRCASLSAVALKRLIISMMDPEAALPAVSGIHLCYQCFARFHGLSDWVMRDLIRKKLAGDSVEHSKKGRQQMRAATMGALEWIDNRVKMLGDYMPHKSYIHLPPGSKKELYDNYVLDCQINYVNHSPVSKATFWHLMKKHFPRVKIPKQKRFAKCDTCDSYDTRIREAFSDSIRQELRREKSKHLDFVVQERRKYYKHRRKAASDPSSHPKREYMSLILDGMDQAKTQVPRVARETSSTKNLYGVPYVTVGVLNHGHNPSLNTFPSQYGKDASLTCHLLSETIRRHFESKKIPTKAAAGKKRVLYVQLDNAGSENKNYAVMGMFALLVFYGVFDKIKVSFLPVGHTHEDVDQMFSCISRALRKHSVLVPSALFDIMKTSYKPKPDVHPVQDVSSLLCKPVLCVLGEEALCLALVGTLLSITMPFITPIPDAHIR